MESHQIKQEEIFLKLGDRLRRGRRLDPAERHFATELYGFYEARTMADEGMVLGRKAVADEKLRRVQAGEYAALDHIRPGMNAEISTSFRDHSLTPQKDLPI